MDFEISEAQELEAGVDATIEFDETDADMAVELQLLAARVQAARHCGA